MFIYVVKRSECIIIKFQSLIIDIGWTFLTSALSQKVFLWVPHLALSDIFIIIHRVVLHLTYGATLSFTDLYSVFLFIVHQNCKIYCIGSLSLLSKPRFQPQQAAVFSKKIN